jgi:predicted secreted acid phosphatase
MCIVFFIIHTREKEIKHPTINLLKRVGIKVEKGKHVILMQGGKAER